MNEEKIKDFVEDVLKYNPTARDNDFGLIMRVYTKMGFARKAKEGMLIFFKNIEYAPSFETITRLRRKFQEEGKYSSTEQIERMRRKREEKMRLKYRKEE